MRNMERKRANDRAYYWANRDKKLAYLAKYKDARREEINEKQREYLAKNRDKFLGRKEDALVASARHALNYAIKSGLVHKGPCAVCGTTDNIRGHHDDYHKPLDVVWLCQKHHTIEHRRNRRYPVKGKGK